MASIHDVTHAEFSIIKTDIDVEAEIDYSCIFNTHKEFDEINDAIFSPSLSESLFSDSLPTEANERAHINIVEMYEQASSEYRAFLSYEDLFSTFVVLRPLKEVPGNAKSIPGIVEKLIDIFSLIGVPKVLESSHGRSFSEKLMRELRKKNPALDIIHRTVLNHNCNRDFKKLIELWQKANPSRSWHEGLHFIQVRENICKFSGSHNKSPQRSPSEIFYKGNLASDLVRFMSNNCSVETISDAWTEDEWLEKTELHKSSLSSFAPLNELVHNNDEEENLDSRYFFQSLNLKELSKTKDMDSIDNKCDNSWMKSFVCWICDKIFKKHCHLVNHMRIHRINQTIKRKRKQKKSSKTFNAAKNVKEIKNNEEKPRIAKQINFRLLEDQNHQSITLTNYNEVDDKKRFECDICKKRFNRKSNLSAHIAIHANVKPYRCDICKCAFSRKNNLKNHIYIHTNYKPYVCKFCNMRCSRLYSLRKHLESMH